jgi:hypothetical protein
MPLKGDVPIGIIVDNPFVYLDILEKVKVVIEIRF